MATYGELQRAINETCDTIKCADDLATRIAQVLVNRLHKVNSADTLRKLKRELRAFNMTTGQWEDG